MSAITIKELHAILEGRLAEGQGEHVVYVSDKHGIGVRALCSHYSDTGSYAGFGLHFDRCWCDGEPPERRA